MVFILSVFRLACVSVIFVFAILYRKGKPFTNRISCGRYRYSLERFQIKYGTCCI